MSESERPKEKAAGYRAVHPDAQAVLDAARQRWGHVPHLLEAMAASRPVVTTYWHHLMPVRPESLDRTEQLLVELTASVANRCDYCVAAHTMGAQADGMGPRMLDALRNGELVPDDPKRRSLQVLTQELIERRGWLTSETRAAALEAGYDEGAIMEVVMLVAIKTLTNYAHHAADVPLDDSMKHPPIRWNPPAEE